MAKSRTDTESVLKLVIDGKQAKTSVNELRDTYHKLNAEINNMKKADNPQLYAEKAANVKKVTEAWKEARQEMTGASKDVVSFKDRIVGMAKDAAGGLMGAGAIYAFINGAKTMIQKNAELSDSIAGVMKTTGLSEEAVDRLNEKFKRMDTRTANTQLLELAQVAGKLGHSAEKDVEGFVRAADKIGVALGEDLGGVEESVNSLGKLVDIFKISDQFELEESLLKVGSAINTLGASGTANEKNLIDFSQRLAGIAPAANISLPNVLALGAVMDELGQSMESSSTAIGQFIVEMGGDIPKFAKIAGMSIKDFSKLMKEDANEAFLRVLEKSKTAGGGIQALASNMGILEVSGARGIAALGAMADNVDKVRDRMNIANVSFDEGTSILNEFDTVNNNLAANLEKLSNKIAQLWENSSARQGLTWFTSKLIEFTDWVSVSGNEVEKSTQSFESQKKAINQLEGETGNLVTRYEELTSKSKLNKEEQIELRTTIDRIAEILPVAVTEWDQYGKAIDISTRKVKELTGAQRTLFETRNKDDIKKMNDLFKSSTRLADTFKERANEATKNIATGNQSRMSRWLGLDEKDIKIGTEQATLAMGRAYDAAIALRDVYGQELTIQQKNVIEGFEGIGKSAEKANKKVADPDNTPDQQTGGGKPKKSTKSGKSAAERKAEENRRIQEDNKKHLAQLLKDEDLFSATQLINQKEKNEREVSQLELSYQKQIEKFEDFKLRKNVSQSEIKQADESISKLTAEKEKAVLELRLKQETEYLESIKDLRNELGQKHQSELDKERDRINEHYDKLKKDFTGNDSALAQIEVDRAKDLADSKIREEMRLFETKKALEKELEVLGMSQKEKDIHAVREKYDNEIKLLKEKNSKEIQETEAFKEVLHAYETNRDKEIAIIEFEAKKKKNEDLKNLAIDSARSISDAVFSIISSNIQAESDARISALEKQRDKELSNKNLSEKQKAAIQEKYDKKIQAEKLRAWKAQKKADLLSATINTALAITKALPNWILAAAAGVAGAAQIAVIASQKPPQFEKGGFIPKGSRHIQGGIDLVDTQSRSILGNIEGGEPILSRSTYANNRELVDALLYNSQRRNGARIQLHPDIIPAERAGRFNSVNVAAPVVNVDVPGNDNSTMIALLQELVIQSRKNKNVVINRRLLDDEENDLLKFQNRING